MEKNILNFYKFISFSNFATSLISIFIPVYLLKNNISLANVILFIIIQYSTCIFVQNLGKFIYGKINMKETIIISYFFIILYYFLIYNFLTFNINLFLIAIINGLGYGLFWLCYHIMFSFYGSNKKRAKQTSITFILRSLTGFIAPIFGTFVLFFFSFKVLFSLTIFILILNIYNLNKFKNILDLKKNITFSQIYKQNFKDYIAFFGHGILIGCGILWSIYVYIYILNDFVILGVLTSFSFLISTFTRFFVGNISQKYPIKTLRFGAFGNVFVWFFKIFVNSSFYVFVIDFFDGITDSIKNIPFNAKSYSYAKDTNVISYNIFREVLITFGIVLIVWFYFFSKNFSLVFLIASFSSFLYFFK